MQAGDLGRLMVLAALWGGSFLFIRVAALVLGLRIRQITATVMPPHTPESPPPNPGAGC